MLTVIAAAVALALFVVLVAFQLALALGAPWGRAAYGGQTPGVLPAGRRVSSAVAVVVNTITRSTIERAIWLPVSIVLLAAVLVVALTSAG